MIIEKEVPTAKCIIKDLSILAVSNIKNKKGTVIKPPPIPNKPAKKPTGNAVKIIKRMNKEYSFDKIEVIKINLQNVLEELI